LLEGRHFADEVIVLCGCWHLCYCLSYRDLEGMIAERNLSVDHITIWRRVQYSAPELASRIQRELKPTGRSWHVDEAYVRVAGKLAYLYRAEDSAGAAIDFYVPQEWDAAAAKQFFRKALAAANHPRPRVINVDGNPSYPKVVTELKQERQLGRRCRKCPYLNNLVEQDHRGVKRRINGKQGFRSLDGRSLANNPRLRGHSDDSERAGDVGGVDGRFSSSIRPLD
jgi:IS6 family transposase